MERVACYIRVSSEEQKLHGISLDAQIDKLQTYADSHNLHIVGWYKDEGVSGRKLIRKRPELQRMLIDAQAHKFDRILFIKLDRFFRSVAEYHECMKMISPVVWTATEEKYDLTTANGRAFVNMKLTIAELEADQTGERIKIVNDYKVKNGQALMGSHSQGLAFKVEKIDGVKRVVRDPDTEPMVRDIIDYFLTYQNKTATCKYISNKYGYPLKNHQLTNMLSDTKLYGGFRGNPEYCEAYVDRATYDRIQYVQRQNIKKTPSGRVYTFSGLIKCPVCGNVICSTVPNHRPPSYRCYNAYTYKSCSFNHSRSERLIERDMLNCFDKFMTSYITSASVTDARVMSDNTDKRINEIKAEMQSLNTIFRKSRISEKEYDRDYEALERELNELEQQLTPVTNRDLGVYEVLVKSNWQDIYNALNKENRRAFWRKYVNQIVIDEEWHITDIIFF